MSTSILKKAMLTAMTACTVIGCAGAGARPVTNPAPTRSAKGSAKDGTVVTSPETAARAQAPNNQFWWPERLDLSALRQHAAESDPVGKDFKYAEAFKKLDLK